MSSMFADAFAAMGDPEYQPAPRPRRNGWLGGENQDQGSRQRETRWLTPSPIRFDEPHRRVRLTHKRCLRWAHSLPVDIRYRGAHQVWVDRMTIGRCHRSLIEAARYALDTTPVKREPVAASAQLDLFESA